MPRMCDACHIKAVQMIKDKQTIYEYRRENELATSLFPVGCIFKSFLSVLVGAAIYEGKIRSIEDCVIDYISHEEITDANWYKLRIKHALSKTTGILWPGPREPVPASMREVMRLRFAGEPGASFRYQPDPQIIVYLLEEIYGLTITELFEHKVAARFTNQEYAWDTEDIQGLKVSIPLLNELGQLMLNRGTLHGKRLFSEAYYEQMLQECSCGGPPERMPYGLGWWLGNASQPPYFCASGFGGQYLAVVPQKNMVISILSDMDRPHPENRDIIRMALE